MYEIGKLYRWRNQSGQRFIYKQVSKGEPQIAPINISDNRKQEDMGNKIVRYVGQYENRYMFEIISMPGWIVRIHSAGSGMALPLI